MPIENTSVPQPNDTAKFFSTPEELSDAAEEASILAQDYYKRSVYLYYIARFMVALHEATIGSIPIQVWNEFRSALDHHMRYLTLQDKTDHKQLIKVEGHLQRAVLDVCKLFTHRTLELLEGKMAVDTIDLLRMVNSGRFYESIRIGIDSAQEHFAKVKTCDATLGNERGADKQIVSKYLGVAFEVWNLSLTYSQARHDIEVAAATRRSIKQEAKSEVITAIHEPWHKKLFDHLLGHIVYYSMATIFGLIVGYLIH